MRYHQETFLPDAGYGTLYRINHPVYDCGTLFRMKDGRGLVVVQQHFIPCGKYTMWGAVQGELATTIYIHHKFADYMKKHAKKPNSNGYYPTVPIRKLMWALRMKPLKKEPWETTFDRPFI